MKKLLIASVLSIYACSSFAAHVPEGTQLAIEQDLTVGNGSEPVSIDPTLVSESVGQRIACDLFEGLVSEGMSGEIVPALAKSWEVSDDQLTYTFYLRDAKWSDGSLIKAQDVVYAWQRLVDPKTAASNSWYLGDAHIVNAKRISNNELPIDTLGVEAVDNKTLVVHLSTPTPYFIYMLTNPVTFPLKQKVVEKYGNAWTKPEHIVVNGPFKLKSWVVNERLVSVRNSQYWDDEHTVINSVSYLPLESSNSEYNRFRAGEINLTLGIPLALYEKIKQEMPSKLVNESILATYYYLLNTSKKPFDDVRVRKALSYSLDRDIITRRVLGEGQISAYSYVPPAVSNYKSVVVDWQSLSQKDKNAKARELLDEAGFNKDNPLVFTLSYNTSEAHKKIAVAVASLWKQNLGGAVKVLLLNEEWKSYLESLKEGNYEVGRYGFAADYNEPSTFLSSFTSNKNIYGHWGSNEYDSTLNRATKAKSKIERDKFYQKAEKILDNNMPAIPIYFYIHAALKGPKLLGY